MDIEDVTITYCTDGIELTMDAVLYHTRVYPLLIENDINFQIRYRDKDNLGYILECKPFILTEYNAEVDISYENNDNNKVAFALYLIKQMEDDYSNIVKGYNKQEEQTDGTNGDSK